jgi:hypothetical protein
MYLKLIAKLPVVKTQAKATSWTAVCSTASGALVRWGPRDGQRGYSSMS